MWNKKKKANSEDSWSSGFSEPEENGWGTEDSFSGSWDEEQFQSPEKKSKGKGFPWEAILAVAVILAGAALILGKHRHIWIEATCTSPKICAECGEVEGEPVGHNWMDATYYAPKTCAFCQKTQGVTLTDNVLEEAERYMQEEHFLQAIALLDARWEEQGVQAFRDMASDCRMRLARYHGTYVAAGKYNSVLVHRDGQITIVGDNKYRERDAAGWTDVVAAGLGDRYVAALRANGTVVAAGTNGDNEYTGVENWRDVVAISAGDLHIVGLLADGTIVSAPGFNHCGQGNVGQLMDAAKGTRIVAVSAGYDHTAALLEDGTVVACGDKPTGGNKENGACNVSGWSQIAMICSGTEFCAGLRTDGTVVVAGMGWDLSEWTDVSSLAAGDFFLLGLRTDGTVLIQMNEEKYNADARRSLSQVEAWENVVYIAAGHDHIIGICSDGSVRCAGMNQKGQCTLEGTRVALDDRVNISE
jgi:hypothetical protein